jgi:hypothetical protein
MLDAGHTANIARLTSVQHLHSAMLLAYIYGCYHFAFHIAGCCCFSILSAQYFRFFRYLYFYGASFPMRLARAVANKEALVVVVLERSEEERRSHD